LFARDAGRSLIAADGSVTTRPVRVDVWYPAAKPSRSPVRYGDYVAASRQDLDFSPLDPERVSAARSQFVRERGESAVKLLDEAMLATRAPRPLPGRHPLVIYAHTATASKCFLSEYLASRGYVVMAPQVVGTYEVPLDVAMSGIETQSRDLEFVLALAAARPYVDATRVAVTGMSFGGLSALAFAMRNPAIDAVISLDGGIGSTSNVQNFGFTRGAFHDVARFTKPLLHLHGPLGTPADLDYLRGLDYSERTFVELRGLKHEDFGGLLRARLEGDAAAVEAFSEMASTAAAFLDRTVAGQHEKTTSLRNGEHYVAATTLHGRPAPPSATELLRVVSSGGIEALRQHHRVLSGADPHPVPAATYRLMIFTTLENERDPELARNIARLYLADYPESSRAALVLGNVEARLKNTAAAAALFKRALELAPRDPLLEPGERDTLSAVARQRLEALGRTTP
jgi:pimeloyl-ACP methyl ester carboxylesterase